MSETRAALLLKANPDPLKGPPRLAHLTAQEYLAYGYISDALFDAYFKFAFVRNPWDRLVSEYRYAHSQRRDFKTFLLKSFPGLEDDHYTEGVDHYRHVLPQHTFIFDDAGSLLVDFVGRYENLQQDFAYVCQRVGLLPIKLRQRNKSVQDRYYKRMLKHLLRRLGLPAGYYKKGVKRLLSGIGFPVTDLSLELRRRPYTEYYDDETRDFVAALYAKDIALFDYHFGQ